MYQTAEECRLAWEAAGKHGSLEARIARCAPWLGFYREAALRVMEEEPGIDPFADKIVAWMLHAGLLHAFDAVLDIGAGTGAYTLPLAKVCQSVCALDMEETSLQAIETQAKALHRQNVDNVHGYWEDFMPDRKYGVTFSALCPAICSVADLLKMEAMTSKCCCLLAIARGSYDTHRGNLMKLLHCTPDGGMATESIWYYEMLYLLGRQPEVKQWSRHIAYDATLADACWRYIRYFEIFGISGSEASRTVETYLAEHATGGLVHETVHMNLSLISWQPKQPA